MYINIKYTHRKERKRKKMLTEKLITNEKYRKYYLTN